MAAVIDWYSKAILSWKISNTMDTALVMDALNDALEQYGQPEIFNTDQGSQYTSHEHTLVQPLSRQNFFYLVPLLLLLSSLLKLLRDRLVIDLHGFLILQ